MADIAAGGMVILQEELWTAPQPSLLGAGNNYFGIHFTLDNYLTRKPI